MNTLNEIRAARLIAILSKKLEAHHDNLLTLQRLVEDFEIQPCKAKKSYKFIINRVVIDTKRIYNLANRYFNHSGSVPKEVDGYTIYTLSDFSYLIKWFEL